MESDHVPRRKRMEIVVACFLEYHPCSRIQLHPNLGCLSKQGDTLPLPHREEGAECSLVYLSTNQKRQVLVLPQMTLCKLLTVPKLFPPPCKMGEY